jgi:4-hydroxy-4-methyl-2-oxoglutarate aldolase
VVQSAFNLEQINLLRSFDTCVIAEAVEAFGVRLRNEGFATSGLRCLFKSLPPMVGYAATCKVRSADPPIVGSRHLERTDWWRHITSISAPRVVVIQDIDERCGTGAFVGKVHANILAALGCVGAVTNGAARELPGMEAAGFQIFAGGLAVSRSYVHIVEYGGPVEIGCLTIKPGDLIHGDRHGILTVPPEIVDQLPAVAREIMKKENHVIELSKRRGVSLDELGEALRDLLDFKANSNRESERKDE